MSSIRQFLRYHKEEVLSETKDRLEKTIQNEENLNQHTFIDILNDFETHLDVAIKIKIKSFKKTDLKNGVKNSKHSSLPRKDLIEIWMNSEEKKAFKKECLENMQTYINKQSKDSEVIIEKEYARRKAEAERNQALLQKRKWIFERVGRGDERIKTEMRKYIAHVVADMFLNDEMHFLFNDVQTVGDLIPDYHYALKIRPACFKRWLLTSITIIKEEKGEDFFKGTYSKSSSPYDLLCDHFTRDHVVINQINHFYETISKEDFKTIFFEGINNNPKLYELWKKQRVRRLVGQNKK